MDNLTHSLTGLLLSRAGLNRFHPQAGWLLFLSANAPDIDAVSAIAGAGTYFQFHRWYTHAWILLPLAPLLPTLVVWLVRRKKQYAWRRAYLLCLIGVFSHILLDWTNAYGIRLFVPFSARWSALDWTSVVDVWIWLTLLSATLWPMLSNLVGAEMGARVWHPGRGWAIAALAFLPLYNMGRSVLHGRAIEVQAGRVYAGQAAQRAFVMPTHFNPWVWDGVVETSSAWILQRVDLRQDIEPGAARVLYKAEVTPAIEAARHAPLIAEFLRFSRTPHWTATPASREEGGTRVEVTDLRFGFTVWALVDASNRVLETGFRFRP